MIFISHRQADTAWSQSIKEFLQVRGVDSYIDVEDTSIKNPKNITEHIIEKLRGCTHIIAVFSVNTRGSYWVPFELGAAYEADLKINTYVFEPKDGSKLELPEYLHAFPIMRNGSDLNKFIEKFKNEDLVLRSGEMVTKSLSEKAAASSRRKADVYIEEMKGLLGQR